jgi:hypothetical protein
MYSIETLKIQSSLLLLMSVVNHSVTQCNFLEYFNLLQYTHMRARARTHAHTYTHIHTNLLMRCGETHLAHNTPDRDTEQMAHCSMAHVCCM